MARPRGGAPRIPCLALLLLLICLLQHPEQAAASRPAPHLGGGGGDGGVLDADLAAAAAQHLGLPGGSSAWASAPEWGPAADAAVVNRTLGGAGFHRDLTYTVVLRGGGVGGGGGASAAAEVAAAAAPTAPPPPRQLGRLLWRMAGFDRSRGPGPTCELAVVQPLPAGLFADPYQLEGSVRAAEQRRRQAEQRRRRKRRLATEGANGDDAPDGFRLLGPLDLELPAPACLPTALVVTKRVVPQAAAAAAAGDAATAIVRLRVPLHAKYPAAVPDAREDTTSRSLGSYLAALSNPQAPVVVPPPLLLLRCGAGDTGDRSSARAWRPPRRLPEADALAWPVPAGSAAHLTLASWGTFWASAAAAAAVVWVVCAEAPRLKA